MGGLPDIDLDDHGVAALCVGCMGGGGCLPDVDLGEGRVAAKCLGVRVYGSE